MSIGIDLMYCYKNKETRNTEDSDKIDKSLIPTLACY